MPHTPFLFTLQQHLPADAFPWAVAALMRDPLIWEALHSDVGAAALETLGSNPTAWHPAALGKLALEISDSAPQGDLPLPPADLAEAAHLARVLLQHHQETGHWRDLPAFLTAEGSEITAWQTALACALAETEDQSALLASLSNMEGGVGLAMHALLCQPVPPEVHAVKLTEFLRRLPPQRRPEALWQLHAARPDLAQRAAPRLPAEDAIQPYAAWQRATQHLAAGHLDDAHRALSRAWEEIRRLNGALTSHHAMLAEQRGDHTTALTAWEQAAASLPEEPTVTARYVLALARARRTEEARNALPEQPQHPALLTAAAHVWQESHPQTALGHAQQALAQADRLPADLLRVLAETLLALHDADGAFRAAGLLARRRPTDTSALDLAVQAAFQAQNWAAAVEHALLAWQHAPSPERLRRLAEAQEAQGLLQAAMHSRRQLVRAEAATTEDHLALARLALRLDALEDARQTVEGILAQHPHHAQALALLGQILVREGKPAEARRHLQAAIAHQPADASPYLILAELVAQTEGDEAALDVLQTATHALPREAEPHYRLGKHLLKTHRPGHARPALETAHQLAPHRTDIVLALAQAYLDLGETAQARDLLASHTPQNPPPAFARLLARAHMAAAQPAEAARVLAPLAQAPDAPAQDLLAYAQALLAAHLTPDRAADALRTALERLDAAQENALLHADILTALAEAHLAEGQPQDALEAYRRALQTLPAGHPKRQQAIACGLAETALQLHRAEIALAAVEEALQQTPHHPRLHRLQAEAYHQLGFQEQALSAAAETLRLENYATATAEWYARMAYDLGAFQHAAAVLENLATTPFPPSLVLLQAKIYHALGRSADALALLRPLLEDADAREAAWCAEAGQCLLALGQTGEAIGCLQRAVHAPDAPIAWHLHLVRAFQAENAFDQAIQTAREALQHDESDHPARIDLHLAIVHSHMAQQDFKQAALALTQALEAHPKNARLLASAVGLWRLLGDYGHALAAAEHYLDVVPDDLLMRARAAQLARALLRHATARKVLQPAQAAANEMTAAQAPAAAEVLATAAELALESGEEIAAAELLTAALEYHPEAPRLLALQARLTGRRIDAAEGRRQLTEAMQQASPLPADDVPSPETIATWETIAEAALELGMWQTARDLAQRLHRACPHSPSAALRVARVHVHMAEAEHRCQAVEARAQAPGADALAPEAAAQWQQALEAAARALEMLPSAAAYLEHPVLKRWYARGVAAFHGRLLPDLLNDAPTPADVAAALDALHRRKVPPHTFPQDHHDHPLVRLHYALLLEHTPNADLGEALQAAEDARQARPQWGAAHFLVARLANRSGQLQQAAEAITAALNLHPEEPRWHALAADIFKDLRQNAAVQQHLAAAIRLEPHHIPHHLALAQAHVEANQPDAALDVLQNALAQASDHLQIHLMLAQTYFQTGQLDKAAHHADRAIRLDRNAEAPVMLRIRIALAQHDAHTAHQRAQRWLQSHPHHPQATLYAARALMAMEKPADALQLVEATLPYAAENMELNILQAELRRQVDGPKAAVSIWRALLASRPNAPVLWLGLAEALAASRQRTPAREAAHKALRHADKLAPEERVRLHLLLGNIAKEEGQLDQAVYHFEKAVRIMPQHLEALLKLGQVQHDRQQYREALEIFTTAQQLAPEDSRPYYLAGMVYKAIKDYENAERMFRQAAQRSPNDIRIRRQLAAVSVINIWQ